MNSEIVSMGRVMVVGCGALGNEVLKNLVLMGVRHITVVDFDTVEADNLTRSVLFSQDDARQHLRKVDVVAERLAKMNPEVRVEAIFGDIAYDVGLGMVRRMDVVIGCVDSRWARYCINRLCMRAGRPWVDGGIAGLEGTVRVFVPGHNCYACNLGPEGLRDLGRRMPCAGVIRRDLKAGKAPTTSIIASIIGAIEVQEALKLLHPEALADGRLASLCGRMFYYEGEQLTTRLTHFKAWDDDCPVHERWEPVVHSTITADTALGQALAELRQLTAHQEVSISLESDCFVDYVSRRSDDHRTPVMKPGRAVSSFVENDTLLKGTLLSDLYQHEYRELDDTFPWQELTLRQLGIAREDILHVLTPHQEFYIAMKKEA